MEKRNVAGVTVNDGGGLFDSAGLCDTLIADCNSLVKSMASGNYVAFCGNVVQMVQKLSKLKTGIKSELEDKDRIIEELKQMNNNFVEQVTGLPVDGSEEKDGADHGAK